jgi:hypothetical protein
MSKKMNKNKLYTRLFKRILFGSITPKLMVSLLIILIILLLITFQQSSYHQMTLIQKAEAGTQPTVEILPEPQNKSGEKGMVEYKIEPRKEVETQQQQQKAEPPKAATPKKEPEKSEEAKKDTIIPAKTVTERVKQSEAKPKLEPNQPSDKWGMKTGAAAENDWGALMKETNVPKTPGYVTNLFYDTPLRNALSEIALQADAIIVPDSSVQGLVTCDLQDVPLEQALQIVLSSGNFVFKQMDGYILVGSADSESPLFTTLSETRRIKMNYIKAEDAVKMLSEPIRKLATANPTNNVVSVTAPEELLERIISDLELFDQPSKHVILDARIVAMEHGDLLNLGVQWDWPNITAGAFSNSDHYGAGAPERVNWPWGIQIGYTPGQEFTNSLMMTLNLLTQNEEAIVIASPRVLAQDGREAEIKVVTEEYFKITQEAYYYTRFELETIETGTILTITPHIGDNNEITLDVSAEVSDVIARGQDNLPVVTRRTTKNTVRIENGGTAVVAGLMDSRKRYQKSRVPGLSSIPLVGNLFDNTNQTDSSRQVAVFVTARLMSQEVPLEQRTIEDRVPAEIAGTEFKIALQKALKQLNRESKRP